MLAWKDPQPQGSVDPGNSLFAWNANVARVVLQHQGIQRGVACKLAVRGENLLLPLPLVPDWLPHPAEANGLVIRVDMG